MRLYDSYDYVIIGAGSAGSTIANRLGEDFRLRILILEAGPPDTAFLLKMPAGFASLGEKSPYNWRYETVPQVHCNNRRMYWPRGKTLGGSSSINAMLYVRGNAWDYDHWRQLGNQGWSYEDVLPFFKKAENNERGADPFHGTGGPLNVADQADPAKISEAFVKAAEQAGHKRLSDFNGAVQEGVGQYQVTQKSQERWSTASAYLRPAVERNKNNVHVITGALVERIILDKNHAMGVRYVVDGRDEVRSEQAGHKRLSDFNGAVQEGVGQYQVTQKSQERWSTASAYLRPAVERNKNNVHVITGALVERIILDKNHAMGVRYVVDGRDEV